MENLEILEPAIFSEEIRKVEEEEFKIGRAHV